MLPKVKSFFFAAALLAGVSLPALAAGKYPFQVPFVDREVKGRIDALIASQYPAPEERRFSPYERGGAVQLLDGLSAGINDAIEASKDLQELLKIRSRLPAENAKVLAEVQALSQRIKKIVQGTDEFFAAGYGSLDWDGRNTTATLLAELYYSSLYFYLPRPDIDFDREIGNFHAGLLQGCGTEFERALAERSYRQYERNFKDLMVSLWKAYQPSKVEISVIISNP